MGDWPQLYQLVSVPSRIKDSNEKATDRRLDLMPAIVRSLAARQPVINAWLSPVEGGRMQFIVGADRLCADAGAAAGDDVRLIYPPGSRGVALGADAGKRFEQLPCWTRCLGTVDSFSRDDDADTSDSKLFEDTVATLTGTPFCWLVIASPVSVADDEIDRLRRTIPMLRNRKDQVEADRLALERAEARLEEILRFRSGGLWDVSVLVGAMTPADAIELSSLLVGAVDLADLPYRLEPGRQVGSLTEALDAAVDGVDPAPRSPFLASAGLVTSIARPPARELPGIRSVAQPEFDVTSESEVGLEVGIVLDRARNDAGPFTVSHSTLNRHAFVCGATGSGKSQTTRTMLERLARDGIPWMVIEPAKSEYARMAGRLEGISELVLIRPGSPGDVAVCLNPLEPEPGFPIQAHIDMVRALFATAFEAQEPFPQVLAKALQQVYEDNGWDLVLSGPAIAGRTPAIPTLGQLQDTARTVVEKIGYGEQVTRDVRGFIDIRVGSLRLGATGRFFEGGHPLDLPALLKRHVVFAIEDISNNEDKAFLIGALVIRLVEHLRLRAAKERIEGLQHVTVIEEAHRLLRNVPNESPAAKNVEIFAEMLAEIRAYGEGIIVAEQIPSKVIPDVIKNTALKLVHRLPAEDDRETVGATMNLSEEQSRYIVTLEPGVAAGFTDGMDAPVLVRMPYGESREREPDGPTPIPITHTRSLACCTDCTQVRACTNREIAEAANRLRLDDAGAVIAVWAELMVVSHLMNEPIPVLDPRLFPLFEAWDRRHFGCLVGQAVDAVMFRRAPAIRQSYQPDDLYEPVMAQAEIQLLSGPRSPVGVAIPGPRPDARWMLQGMRWLDAYREVSLLQAEAEAPLLRYPLRDIDGDGRGQTAYERRTLLLGHPWGLHLEQNRFTLLDALEGIDQLKAVFSAAERIGVGTNPEERAISAGRLFLGEDLWYGDMLFEVRGSWLRDGRVYLA